MCHVNELCDLLRLLVDNTVLPVAISCTGTGSVLSLNKLVLCTIQQLQDGSDESVYYPCLKNIHTGREMFINKT